MPPSPTPTPTLADNSASFGIAPVHPASARFRPAHARTRALVAGTAGALLAALAILPATTTPAAAQSGGGSGGSGRGGDPGLYLRGGLGYSTSLEDEIDYSPLWHLGVGYRFTPNLRLDVTADWRDRYIVEGGRGQFFRDQTVDSQVDNQAFMANVYYDFASMQMMGLPGGIRPYVGGGLGFSTISVDDSTVLVDINNDDIGDDIRDFFGDESDQFAWQLMAGVAYDITDNAFFDVGYRYADLGEVELASTLGTIESELRVHEILVSLGYRF